MINIDDFKNHCLTCEKYNPTTKWSDINSEKGFWCSKYGWTDPYDRCSSYYDGGYSKAFLEDCMKEYNKKKHYYIVTTACKIMGLPEGNQYREMFARICEEYLMGTKDGEQLLADYDVYGSEVAWIMESMNSQPGFRTNLKNLIRKEVMPEFDKMLTDVNNDKVNKAVLRYIVLTRKLMKQFNIGYKPQQLEMEETEYSPIHDTLLAYSRSKQSSK